MALSVGNTRGNCNCESLKVVSFEVVEELKKILVTLLGNHNVPPPQKRNDTLHLRNFSQIFRSHVGE